MRKAGWFSFIYYLLYAIGGFGMAIYNYIAIQKLNAEGGGLEGIGLALLMIVGIIFGAAGLLGVILKLVHMKSGWVLFGLLCIALDVALAGVWITMAAPSGNAEQLILNDLLSVLPYIALSLVSVVTNALSLKD